MSTPSVQKPSVPSARRPMVLGTEETGNVDASAVARAPALRSWRWLTAILAGACLVVGGAMLSGLLSRSAEEPWSSKALLQAHAELRADPKNEALKNRVRDLDLELRRAYFTRLDRNRTGSALLVVGGGLVVVSALRGRRDPKARAPLMRGAEDARGPESRALRRSVVATGLATVALGGVVAGLGWGREVRLDGSRGAQTATAGTDVSGVEGSNHPAATSAAILADPTQLWPQFRGLGGAGQGVGREIPLKWDPKTRENVRWRTEMPLEGYNSPVVWSNRVFLTGGNKRERLVFAVDATSGALVWQRPVTPEGQAVAAVEPPDQSGMAASTVATDGQQVWAIFASGDLGALDFDGRLVWSKKFDLSENGYGHASSLVVHDGTLLVQLDRGQAEDGKSELLALNAREGTMRWRAARPVGGSWATPLVVARADGVQVILSGDPLLAAYDLATGKERWRAAVLGGELAPSPVLAGDLVIATSPGHALLGVRLDGTGDVTASHVAWKLETEIPDVPTPLVVDGLLFTADTEGHVHCRDAATGVKVWSASLEMEIQASPIVSAGRIFLLGQPGTVVVLRAARAQEELARFETGEEVYATPAMADGSLFVRTRKALLRVAAADAAGKEVARAN
ncbi:MAG: PQQ-binding-like beta-propeller repeat protein [Verrucomicrobiales bacterium]|nr:PQQ-binding-like beta-propeller repeat protein [Verrucomicrobiales bacterium]